MNKKKFKKFIMYVKVIWNIFLYNIIIRKLFVVICVLFMRDDYCIYLLERL